MAALATAGRILYILLAKRSTDTCGSELCGDALYYSGQAFSLAAGAFFEDPARPGMPAADHPPVTALLLTPVTWIFGSVLAQRIFMAVLGGLVVFAVGMFAKKVGGPAVGLLAACMAAIYPNFWSNDVLVMSETPATLATVAVLAVALLVREDPSPRKAALAGAAVGLATLTRAELALFGPLLLAPLILTRGERKRRILTLVLAGGAASAMLAPWVAFNLARFEEPVLVSTNDGLTLAGSYCKDVFYGGSLGLWRLDCAEPRPPGDQSEVSAEYRRRALEFLRDHELRLPVVAAVRVLRTWSLWAPDQMVWYNQGEGREAWVSWVGLGLYYLLLPLAVVGGVLIHRRGGPTGVLLAPVLVTTLVSAAFYGLVRFRVPAEVSIVTLASVAVVGVLDRTRARARRHDGEVGLQPERPRFPTLDAYRGIGMTMVLLAHVGFATGFDDRHVLGRYVSRLEIAVPMFFVLSGFLLFWPYAKAILGAAPLPSTIRFLRSRALRILPAWWFALVGTSLLWGPGQMRGVGDWLANALLLPQFGVDVPYRITQAWSIGVEASFYVLLPVIAAGIAAVTRGGTPRDRLVVTLSTLGLVWGVGQVFRGIVLMAKPSWDSRSLLWLPMYLDFFALGMCAACISVYTSHWSQTDLFDRLTRRPWLCWSLAAALVLLVAQMDPPEVPFGLNGAEYFPRQFAYGIASVMWLAPGFFGDQGKGLLRRVLASRPLVWAGAISLSFYLWHLDLIEQVKRWIVPGYEALVVRASRDPAAGLALFTGEFEDVAVVAFVVTLITAAACRRLVEAPFLAMKNRSIREFPSVWWRCAFGREEPGKEATREGAALGSASGPIRSRKPRR